MDHTALAWNPLTLSWYRPISLWTHVFIVFFFMGGTFGGIVYCELFIRLKSSLRNGTVDFYWTTHTKWYQRSKKISQSCLLSLEALPVTIKNLNCARLQCFPKNFWELAVIDLATRPLAMATGFSIGRLVFCTYWSDWQAGFFSR